MENVAESPTPDNESVFNLVEAVDPIVNSGGTVASELPGEVERVDEVEG